MFKLSKLIFALVLVVGITLFFVRRNQYLLEVSSEVQPSAQRLSSSIDDKEWPHIRLSITRVREALWDAADKGFVKPDEFEILDFDSGDVEHGWNPNFLSNENPGTERYSIVGDFSEDLLNKEIKNLSSGRAVGKQLITIRRYKYTKGGDMDFLYFVIPMINEKKCKKIANISLKISQEIRVDGQLLNGCITMMDGTISLIVPIIYRLRISSGSKWAMEPRLLATP